MKKFFVTLLSVTMALTTLAGCNKSGDNTDNTDKTADAEGKETIEFILWDYKEGTYDYKMVQEFEKAHPEYKVNVMTAPSKDYETKLTTVLTGGSDIDVFLGKSNTVYPTLVNNGFAKDLSDKISQDKFDLAPFGTLLETQYKLDGKIYGLPYRTNDWVLFYNKDLFDQAGVEYPSNDMTWQQVRDTAMKLTSGEGADRIYGLGFVPKPGFILPMMINNIPNFDITSSDLSGLETPLNFFNQLQFEDKCLQEYAESKSMNQDQTIFFKGQKAMFYDGSWLAQMLSDSPDVQFKWGIAKGPKWEGQDAGVFVTSTPVLINDKTTKEDAAWEFLKFYVGEEGATIMAQSKMIPSYQTEAVMNTYKETLGLDEDSMAAVSNNTTYDFGPAHIQGGVISSAFNEELELFITQNQDASTTVQKMTDRRAEILKENN